MPSLLPSSRVADAIALFDPQTERVVTFNDAACEGLGYSLEAFAALSPRALPAEHPLCGGSGTDNRVAVTSDRYPLQPLVIQGPGAGAEVTAAALLDDVLRISAA